MAKTNNKQCKCCGATYSYCPSCNHSEPNYKAFVCSEECNSIWTILSRNGVGLATAQETVDALNAIKMPKNLQQNVVNHIARLKAEVTPVVEEKNDVEISTEQLVPVVVEPVKSYKKQKKVVFNEQPFQE